MLQTLLRFLRARSLQQILFVKCDLSPCLPKLVGFVIYVELDFIYENQINN